jgi:hypothetical protein
MPLDLTAGGTRAATLGSAGVLELEVVEEDVPVDGGTGLAPAFLVVEDELLLPHPAIATRQISESRAANPLLLRKRIWLLLVRNIPPSVKRQDRQTTRYERIS